MACEAPVILVLGDEEEYKSRAAEALAKHCEATIAETTKGGVRRFRKNSSSDAVVIETTPFGRVDKNRTAHLAITQKWTSLNALRRLCGRLITVICVVTWFGPEDSLHLDGELNWLHLVGSLFRKHKQTIRILVKLLAGTEDSEDLRKTIKHRLCRDFGYVYRNIIFESMVEEHLIQTVREIHLKNLNDTSISFCLKKVTSDSGRRDRDGPWGPERVILMGRTGSGKSTLFQMLTKGRLDPPSTSGAGSSIRGDTKEITRGQGRGWYVVDTPGFGEIKDEHTTISTEEADKRLTKFVSNIEGTYSHYIYVVMKGRIDSLEKTLWGLFEWLFDGGQNFTVVVSDADQAWVEQNLTALQSEYRGCESFLGGEFPPVVTDDENWEVELQRVRDESLKRLEDELASLGRRSTPCDSGSLSSISLEQRQSNAFFEPEEEEEKHRVLKPVNKVLSFASGLGIRIAGRFYRSMCPERLKVRSMGEKGKAVVRILNKTVSFGVDVTIKTPAGACLAFAEVLKMLKEDEKFLLLPG